MTVTTALGENKFRFYNENNMRSKVKWRMTSQVGVGPVSSAVLLHKGVGFAEGNSPAHACKSLVIKSAHNLPQVGYTSQNRLDASHMAASAERKGFATVGLLFATLVQAAHLIPWVCASWVCGV